MASAWPKRVNGALSFLVSDLLGNAVMAISSSGTATAVELYESYGSMNYSWGTIPTAHNYTSQRLDSQSMLLYYNFHWYDPLPGQFARTDNMQNNVSGRDPYAYVGNDPETRNNPSGHCFPFCTAIIGTIAGAVIGAPVGVATQAVTNVVEHQPITNGSLGQQQAVQYLVLSCYFASVVVA